MVKREQGRFSGVYNILGFLFWRMLHFSIVLRLPFFCAFIIRILIESALESYKNLSYPRSNFLFCNKTKIFKLRMVTDLCNIDIKGSVVQLNFINPFYQPLLLAVIFKVIILIHPEHRIFSSSWSHEYQRFTTHFEKYFFLF